MDFKALDRGELVATIGGLLLGVSLLLNWYSLGNRNATLNQCKGPNSSCTGWSSLSVLRYLLLVGALAPAILTYIVLRGHALSWPRGELTAIVALVALMLTIFRGVLDKPGSPSGEISIGLGWWVAMIGGVGILTGSIWRSRESGATRKPAGVL
jgi:hypothetical protein